jgi:hypothetical protein
MKAQELDDQAEKAWKRKILASIISSTWSGGMSRLEQIVERQEHTLR